MSEPSSPPSDGRFGSISDPHVRLAQFSSNTPQMLGQDLRSYSIGPSDTIYNGTASPSSTVDEDEGDGENPEEGMYPAKLIKKERQRNSFFGTVLGPSGASKSPSNTYPSANSGIDRCASYPPDSGRVSIVSTSPIEDPVAKGLMNEQTAENIIDMVLIRLNPFINLFDPELHSALYIRNKCPFLFTTLLMAGSKFFKPSLYVECRRLADEHAVRAFAESRKSVEIVQAFMCLTYWKEPDDTVSLVHF